MSIIYSRDNFSYFCILQMKLVPKEPEMLDIFVQNPMYRLESYRL